MATTKHTRWFQFSLQTLILIGIWFAVAFLVWHRREPWAPEPGIHAELETPLPQKWSDDWLWQYKSPDGTRVFDGHDGGSSIYNKGATFGNGALFEFLNESGTGRPGWPVGFWYNDRFVFDIGDEDAKTGERTNHKFVYWHRRFPEWWWGHFYRPEVWLLAILSMILSWRCVKAIRTRSKPEKS